jgi:hypothetical protein
MRKVSISDIVKHHSHVQTYNFLIKIMLEFTAKITR